jgi:uncharacterized protein
VSEPKLPTHAEALDILSKAGCSEGVIAHCKTVSKFAVKIAKAFSKKGYDVNVHLVEVSGLLHDIGRSKTHGVNHALVGAQIARSFNLPDSIVHIIERHAGGGISKEEAKLLGWPAKDYLPRTLEEKIVCYADKRVEGLRTVSIERAFKPYIANLGKNHPAIDRIKKLHAEIVGTVGDVE